MKKKGPSVSIEITSPEVEALIRERLKSGAFANAEDVILHALRSFEAGQRTGADRVAAMQASPYRETEIEPAGEPGSALRRFSFLLDPVAAREMMEAVEEECERVDAGEW